MPFPNSWFRSSRRLFVIASTFAFAFFVIFFKTGDSHNFSSNSLEKAQISFLFTERIPGQQTGGSGAPNLLTTIEDNSLMAGSISLAQAVQSAHSSEKGIVTYEVVEGDNLSFIARDFNVDVRTIVGANKLQDIDTLSPGTVLKIPPVKGVVHTVKSGDTISGLSARYDVKSADILAFNNMSANDILSLGKDVIIPGGKYSTEISQSISYPRSDFSHLPQSSGYLLVPVNGTVTQKWHGRNAFDIGAKCGTPIYASAAGKVTNGNHSGWNYGYGLWLQITHANGSVTRYAHNSVNLVDVGATVSKGQLIARVGTTGKSTGCHVHFEVHGMENPAAKM